MSINQADYNYGIQLSYHYLIERLPNSDTNHVFKIGCRIIKINIITDSDVF